MRKSFLSNFLVLLLTNILIKPFWIISDLWVQRNTGEDYGVYFVLFNLSLIINIICDLGIGNFNNRKIAAIPNRFQNYFAKASMLRLLLALIYLFILLVLALVFSYQGKSLEYLIVLGVNQILLSSILFLRSNLTALKFFKTDSLMAILDRILMIIGILIYVVLLNNPINISVFIYIQFYAYLLTFGIVLWVLHRNQQIPLPKWNSRFNKILIQKSLPYALIVVLMMLYTYTDAIMIDQLLPNGTWHNMIYAQSHRILMAVNNYAYLIAVILLPSFATMIKHKSNEINTLLKLAASILLIGLSFFILISVVYSNNIITLLYGKYPNGLDLKAFFSGVYPINIKEIHYSQKVYALLLFSLIPMGINYTYGALLTAKGKMKILNLIALSGVILNVILNTTLIPYQGAYGAAIASVSTQYLCAILQIWYTYKVFNFSLPFMHFFKFVLAIGVLIIFVLSLDTYIKWYWNIFFSGLLLIPILFLLQIISMKQIKQLVKSKKNTQHNPL